VNDYKYLGNFAACEPWAAVGMSCDKCKVQWTGCWDNYQCPKCGEGELPWLGDEPFAALRQAEDPKNG